MNHTHPLLAGASVLALIGFFACGGIVVIDVPGEGGMGGTSPVTTGGGQGGAGQGGAGASCPVPPPVGQVIDCTSSAVSSGSGPLQCVHAFCDSNNNVYTSECSGNACTCIRNSVTLCSCAVPGPGEICASSPDSCCPFPFAN